LGVGGFGGLGGSGYGGLKKKNKNVPKRDPSPQKNEVLDEKLKIDLHRRILVFVGKVPNF